MVFMAALSCLVSSATWEVAFAISILSRLSRLLSSAMRRLIFASSMVVLLSLCAMKPNICEGCQPGPMDTWESERAAFEWFLIRLGMISSSCLTCSE